MDIEIVIEPTTHLNENSESIPHPLDSAVSPVDTDDHSSTDESISSTR
jgi:hypothetical protein